MTVKLSLTPDKQGYVSADGNEVKNVALRGGLGRYRRDMLDSNSIISVSWTLNATDYDTLVTFYLARTTGVDADIFFLIDLIIDLGTVTEHTARFMPSSFSLQSVQGETYVAVAQLEVEPIVVDTGADNTYITAYEALHP